MVAKLRVTINIIIVCVESCSNIKKQKDIDVKKVLERSKGAGLNVSCALSFALVQTNLNLGDPTRTFTMLT